MYGLLFGLGVFVAKKKEWITPSNPWLLSLPVAAASFLFSFVGLLVSLLLVCNSNMQTTNRANVDDACEKRVSE